MKTVNVAPKWAETVGLFKVVMQDGSEKGRAIAWEEIERMAKLADQRNQMGALLADIVGMNSRTFKLFKKKAAALLAASKEAR